MMPSSTNLLEFQIHSALPRILPEFLARQRWFGGKARAVKSTEVLDIIPAAVGEQEAFVVLVRIEYTEGHEETYALPIIRARGEKMASPGTGAAIPSLHLPKEGGAEEMILHDAFWDKEFNTLLFDAIFRGKRFAGSVGEVVASPTQAFGNSWNSANTPLEPSVLKGEQSNTSIRYGDLFILKFYRRLEEGINPDLEIGVFLTDKASFANTPPIYGALEYLRPKSPPVTLGILQAFVPNGGDAWRYTLGTMVHYFENVLSLKEPTMKSKLPSHSIFKMAGMEAPSIVSQLIGDYWESAGLLGRRTAELHLALASDSEDPNFRPEPLSLAFQQSQYESMRGLTRQVMNLLEKRLPSLPSKIQGDAAKVLKREKAILARFAPLAKDELTGELIRIHGDYHLGQVLYTGSDFVIIDFEGEPARSLQARREKRCPLQDVAGILRSFQYAAYTALSERGSMEAADREAQENLEGWARYWQAWVSARFLGEYLKTAAQARFLPHTERELSILLHAYLLEKAVYELGYELNNRPDWVQLPLQGILQILEGQE